MKTRVADALSKRRGYAELPAAVSNVQDARRYLDRIFQFRLEIPPFPKRDMRSFVLSLLTTEFSALQTDLHQRGIDELELVDSDDPSCGAESPQRDSDRQSIRPKLVAGRLCANTRLWGQRILVAWGRASLRITPSRSPSLASLERIFQTFLRHSNGNRVSSIIFIDRFIRPGTIGNAT